MKLYSLIPLVINSLIIAKVIYDILSVQTGMMSRAQMSTINELYDNLLFLAIVASLAAFFLQDKRIKIASVILGVIAIITILTNERTFMPEFQTTPMYIESNLFEDE
jgi:uncharacterized membrane protein